MRKHRRLIDVDIRPLRLSIAGKEPPIDDFTPVATGWLRVNEKIVLGLMRKGAPQYEMKFIPHVAVNEIGLVHRRPIVATLGYLADLSESIIRLFDY